MVFKSSFITSPDQKAIDRAPRYGPVFGGHDFKITKYKCNLYTSLGKNYQLPPGVTYTSARNYHCSFASGGSRSLAWGGGKGGGLQVADAVFCRFEDLKTSLL